MVPIKEGVLNAEDKILISSGFVILAHVPAGPAEDPDIIFMIKAYAERRAYRCIRQFDQAVNGPVLRGIQVICAAGIKLISRLGYGDFLYGRSPGVGCLVV